MASLRDLGLSEYETRVYRSLLHTGPTTAKELSRASEVPMGRIYDVLSSIEGQNLVRSQTASRPKKYVAVEPDTALERLLEDKRREAEETVARYEELVETLGDELESAEPVEEQFWTAAVGDEETLELLLERLAAADESIVMVVANRSPQFDFGEIGDVVTERLEAAVERGVNVSVLMTPAVVETLPESVGERYRGRLSSHPAFSVRTTEDLDGTFNLIDGVEVVLQVSNPLKPGEVFSVIDLKDPTFATGIHEEFAPRWEEANPLSF
ncbi:TrmB family transcriptional regulator [Halalkalicoccus jeotgali]|uniref:Transcriptional regulator TrmB n=1 Tax=Halalkalicoccus jeotgali (strain DSM 18796 / CECT 7217 / JCM 14584 / KCTC 4019 / B3) TaxID=795797 RepID=D8J616_HALJB|nr:helix-turn-helix domain-containing protein [Halalkalicoccus jeotgali]ADJ13822.1 transcriptional regulator, TrmB [Halalkalicoccus jeotgali B3]ELY34132.1 transcriptional regulator TrmB [Halalkalicoccus jeotgali B3]